MVFAWRQELPSEGLGGIAADERRVLLGCRDPLDRNDIFLCLDADTGKTLWQLSYAAAGQLDYGNTPRATPLIVGASAILLGAFGDLHCVDLETGAISWRKNFVRDFGGTVPIWGFCGTPLVVDQRLIFQTGAENPSLVAVDLESGDLTWQVAGRQCSYSSLVWALIGPQRQIIGLDHSSLGGWSLDSGNRLWEVVANQPNDFNVPTPLVDETGVMVATENNGARRYEFDDKAIARPKPTATFNDFAPDTHTAVQTGDRIFGVHGDLYCLDAKTLQPIWVGSDDGFGSHTSIVASPEAVLVVTAQGELLLVDAQSDHYVLISRARLAESNVDVFSHPAFVGKKMYVRLGNSIACLDLSR